MIMNDRGLMMGINEGDRGLNTLFNDRVLVGFNAV